jgi:hypothetical protein
MTCVVWKNKTFEPHIYSFISCFPICILCSFFWDFLSWCLVFSLLIKRDPRYRYMWDYLMSLLERQEVLFIQFLFKRANWWILFNILQSLQRNQIFFKEPVLNLIFIRKFQVKRDGIIKTTLISKTNQGYQHKIKGSKRHMKSPYQKNNQILKNFQIQLF